MTRSLCVSVVPRDYQLYMQTLLHSQAILLLFGLVIDAYPGSWPMAQSYSKWDLLSRLSHLLILGILLAIVYFLW